MRGESASVRDTNTCSCLGGTECTVSGGDGAVTLVCEGNARCDLECGDDCTVECPGTSGCVATMGDDSTASCAGTAECDYVCKGDCSADCPGTSRCTVTCAPGFDCDMVITSCGGMVTECADGLACRTACPE
jgi:hypothetical protein